MIIDWHMGKQAWAFRNLCLHLMRQMTGHQHKANDTADADVVFLVCPAQLDHVKDRSRVIQHMDSNRWYEAGELSQTKRGHNEQ